MNAVKEVYQRELLKAQLEIREETLQNISQEIHDNIGQVLSLANLQLTAIELNDNPFATTKIYKSMELVSKAISDLRNLSKTLNAEHIVKLGLRKSVEFDLELIEKSGVFTTSMQVTGGEQTLHSSIEIIVYRIIQEALNNVIKHSQAKHISVDLNYTGNELLIQITDDGAGFSRAGNHSNVKAGAGLQNMINRAQLIHAAIHIESEPFQGTSISLSVPYANSNI